MSRLLSILSLLQYWYVIQKMYTEGKVEQTSQQISSFRKFLSAKWIHRRRRRRSAPDKPRWHRLAPSPGPSGSRRRWSCGRQTGTWGRWRGRRPSRCRTSSACPSVLSVSPGSGFRCCLVLKEEITYFSTVQMARIEIQEDLTYRDYLTDNFQFDVLGVSHYVRWRESGI